MIYDAIQDLQLSGMDTGEIFIIVEECFGKAYASRLCKKTN